ncbi:MAG TPA: metalloregulator ArsR/SmtB family transcription factor [Acidimicrobiales bacterium]|nr:metalloregulator ArsR/SmtB family transcription factor [Acidimicrobiales bacterium]
MQQSAAPRCGHWRQRAWTDKDGPLTPDNSSQGGKWGPHALSLGPNDDSRPIYALKADVFRVLGHPARVRIIELLRDGERSVGSLQVSLGLDSGGTSQHLAILRNHGLVARRREGTTAYYRVADDAIFGLLEAARLLLGRILGRQQALLTEIADSLSDEASPPSPHA